MRFEFYIIMFHPVLPTSHTPMTSLLFFLISFIKGLPDEDPLFASKEVGSSPQKLMLEDFFSVFKIPQDSSSFLALDRIHNLKTENSPVHLPVQPLDEIVVHGETQ